MSITKADGCSVTKYLIQMNGVFVSFSYYSDERSMFLLKGNDSNYANVHTRLLKIRYRLYNSRYNNSKILMQLDYLENVVSDFSSGS